MATVVLISCVKKKLDHAAPAKDLYTSPLFRLSWKYAYLNHQTFHKKILII
jgi:hypothetical protein